MKILGRNVTAHNVINRVRFEATGLKAKSLGRSITFVRTQELIDWSRAWAKELPRHDVVVGIPRSGLIPAIAMAYEMDVPFSTPELLAQHQGFKATEGLLAQVSEAITSGTSDKDLENMITSSSEQLPIYQVSDTILLVDDTANTGGAMDRVRALMPADKVVTCASVIGTKEYRRDGWHYYKMLPRDRFCEWNFTTIDFSRSVSDMDGLLCVDAPLPSLSPGEDYLKVYETWIAEAEPRFIPHGPVGTIITARAEKYRKMTEQWLAEHNVTYGQLLMETTQDQRIVFINKMKVRPTFVLESDIGHARKIWKRTGIPTFCTDSMQIYSRGSDS